MRTKKPYIHRGDKLKDAVKKSKYRIEQVAKKAGYSRSSYYNHIEEPNLSFEILEQYGKALKYDFTEDFPEMHKYLFEDPSEQYPKQFTYEEVLKEKDYWRDKYYSLLERYYDIKEKGPKQE